MKIGAALLEDRTERNFLPGGGKTAIGEAQVEQLNKKRSKRYGEILKQIGGHWIAGGELARKTPKGRHTRRCME